MKKEQRLENLTIKNNFMFGAVMMNPENCKGFLERVLGLEIDYVEVSREKVLSLYFSDTVQRR